MGYQLSYQANSREFQYLTDSYNHMSGQLQHQFNRLYQEELALRDAHIKALQAHINPHFLNNTLEIINWEARMEMCIRDRYTSVNGMTFRPVRPFLFRGERPLSSGMLSWRTDRNGSGI